ncbi:MAG: hypothetical protein J0L86_07865 [Flavobacteriales bacterium]|nr:hypothetical protein [Flavobacteriales bacterium]
MTKEDFFNQLNQLDLDAQEYLRLNSTIFKDFAIGLLTLDSPVILSFISLNDWSGLKDFSLSKISLIEQKLQTMETPQSEINAFVNRLYELKSGFQDFYDKPNTQETWETLKTTLETEMLNAGLTQEYINDFVYKFGNNGGIKVYNNRKIQYANILSLLNYSFERHLAIYMYHKSCIAFAEYNLIGNTTQPLTYNVSTKITSLLNSIKSRNNTIYENVKDENTSSIIIRTKSLELWVSSIIETDIIPILAYAHQERISDTATFTADGKRAMKAGVLLQNALFSLSACKWISWTSKWHKELEPVKELFSAAQTTINSPIQYSGDRVAINTFSSNPLVHDNKDVIINGVIQNLVARHISPTKVISTAEVINDNGNSVKITLPYIKLDSCGLVNGSYVEISGKFLIANPEAANQPAISIDRLAIKELAKTNWTGWLRYQLRTIYEPIAHNLAVSFSLGLGNDGGINPIKYDTTYSKPTIFSINQKIF